MKDDTPVEKRVEVEIPSERVDDEIEEQYQEVQKQARVKGFRPGKAPRKVLERLFRPYVHEKVMQKLVQETLEPALARKHIVPAVEPVIDPAEVEPGRDYAYTVHVEVHPQVEVKDYKGVQVSYKPERVGDEDVDEYIQRIREHAAMVREPEAPRPVQKGDQVTAQITIKEGDQELESGDTEQVIDLDGDIWIPGLDERLAGREVGDMVTFTEEVPAEEYVPEPFREKTLTFEFKISGIKEKTLPELDDDFAREYTRYESLDQMRASLKEEMEKDSAQRSRNMLHEAIIDELIKLNPVEVPPGLVKRESSQMAKNLLARTSGRDPSDDDAERFAGAFSEQAKKSIQASYILQAIGLQEGIEAGDDDLEAIIEREAERAGMHADKLRDRLTEEQREALKSQAAIDKTLDFLEANASISDEAG